MNGPAPSGNISSATTIGFMFMLKSNLIRFSSNSCLFEFKLCKYFGLYAKIMKIGLEQLSFTIQCAVFFREKLLFEELMINFILTVDVNKIQHTLVFHSRANFKCQNIPRVFSVK